MKNGPYELVRAPEDFPGKRYRGLYCYEHTLVYWQNTGIVPKKGECVHHINEKKRDNRFENLELKTKSKHMREHCLEKGRKMVELRCPSCGTVFTRERSNTHLNRGGLSKRTYCTRKCAGRGSKGNGQNVIREFRR